MISKAIVVFNCTFLQLTQRNSFAPLIIHHRCCARHRIFFCPEGEKMRWSFFSPTPFITLVHWSIIIYYLVVLCRLPKTFLAIDLARMDRRGAQSTIVFFVGENYTLTLSDCACGWVIKREDIYAKKCVHFYLPRPEHFTTKISRPTKAFYNSHTLSCFLYLRLACNIVLMRARYQRWENLFLFRAR